MIKLATIIGTIFLILSSCSSELKVKEYSENADPKMELERVNENINQAQEKQADILSPKYFTDAKSSRDKAVDLRSKDKDKNQVLHRLAIAQANLDKANEIVNNTSPLLKGPLTARQEAIDARATILYPKEFEKNDKQFAKLAKQVDKGDTKNIEKKRDKIEVTYRELELNSIKKEKLGAAKETIEVALKEGARKMTPITLARTEKIYSDNEGIIENKRHDTTVINKASEETIAAANRLLRMVREAKELSTKKPEELARQAESAEQALLRSQAELAKKDAEIESSKNKLKSETAKKSELESLVNLDKEFEKARQEFTEDEAEVYKQGNKLVIRLKGLSFAKNKAEIDSKNFSLLSKVQKVIDEIAASQVTIEGHTDSVGGKKKNNDLSMKRAESVQSYLIANGNLNPDKVVATGLGDEKPIATNKTAEGRAQNRRVDVIISTPENKEIY